MSSLSAKYSEFSQTQLDDEFITACSKGDLKLVKFLLTSPKLKRHAQVDANINLGFRCACAENNTEIVAFLLKFPKFKNSNNLDFLHNEGFRLAATNKNYSVLKCFIFDLKIQKNHEIIHHLKNTPDPHIEAMFDIRDLNQQLNKDLPSHHLTNKKPKI